MALKKTTDTEETAEKKTAAKKPAVKKTAVKKTAAAEKTSAKKSPAEEKSEVKKTTTVRKSVLAKKSTEEPDNGTPKATRKRTAKKSEPKVSIVVEYAGKQVNTDDVVASVIEAYVKENPDNSVETVEIYIQPEKNLAYYVVNNEYGKNTKVKI